MDLEGIRDLYGRARYLQCLREADLALRDATGDNQVQLLWLAGKASSHLGLWPEASRYLQRLMELDPPKDLRPRAIVALARVLVHIGEPGEAERNLLALMSSMDGGLIRAQALHNLGLAYERQKQYRAAASAYTQAADEFEKESDYINAVASLQNAAWLGLAESLENGSDLLARASSLRLKVTETLRAHQVALESFEAFLAGRFQEALEAAEEILQPSHQHATDWDRTLAAYVACRVAQEESQPLMAHAFGQRARDFGTHCNDVRLLQMVADATNNLRKEG